MIGKECVLVLNKCANGGALTAPSVALLCGHAQSQSGGGHGGRRGIGRDFALAMAAHEAKVVVNDAGILRDRFFFNMSAEEWQAVVDVHLNGTFYVSRASASTTRAWRRSARTRAGSSWATATSRGRSTARKISPR